MMNVNVNVDVNVSVNVNVWAVWENREGCWRGHVR
jgi:hypothetical protein